MKYTLLALVLGCSSTPFVPAPVVGETEAACSRALEYLRVYREQHIPCDEAKARVRQAEPLCPLTFHCHKDGGVE